MRGARAPCLVLSCPCPCLCLCLQLARAVLSLCSARAQLYRVTASAPPVSRQIARDLASDLQIERPGPARQFSTSVLALPRPESIAPEPVCHACRRARRARVCRGRDQARRVHRLARFRFGPEHGHVVSLAWRTKG